MNAMTPVVRAHGTMDWETRSAAGFQWNDATGKYEPMKGARDKGISTVGTAAYAEHPSTEILTLAYKLPAWCGYGGRYRWRPGEPLPELLFWYLSIGGTIEAHNAFFETYVWEMVAHARHGWPSVKPWLYQFRCSAAKARVNSFPGALKELAQVLGVTPKDPEGERLIKKFSIPRNPTKKDPRHWISPDDEPAEFERFRAYCDQDVETEEEASELVPEMSADELLFWWIDQEIAWRGVGIDRRGIRDCMAVLEQALERYGDECRAITGLNPTQGQALIGWLRALGVHTDSLDEDHRADLLKRMANAPPSPAKRVVEIIDLIGSASVKKLYAMENQACRDDRLRNLIIHHGARTGRPTGAGPQPLNLPRGGPDLKRCGACARPFAPTHASCPWCGAPAADLKPKEWGVDAVEAALELMQARSLELVEYYLGDAVSCISGCLRGLFCAAPGHDLIASDYSAIEAVVTAMLAGEEWRIEAFRQKKDIYLAGAARITGKTYEWYKDYEAQNGAKHPDRQDIGKRSELALGFMGWINAWRVFDDTDRFTDAEVKQLILKWRDASPRIVELAGGQSRGRPWDRDYRQEFYGFEGAACQALLYPGHVFTVSGIQFFKRGNALIVKLLSGRELTYNDARLTKATREYAAPWEYTITYYTWNTNPKYGGFGWVAMNTYAGKLIENIVQATAHDILRHAIINLRAAGYPCVLHVYDEIICEIPQGTGSLEEFERIMATLPAWAAGWPIRADGGWKGRRYRKG